MTEKFLDLEIRISSQGKLGYPVYIKLESGHEFGPGHLNDSIKSCSMNEGPEIVGTQLFDTLFADQKLRQAWDIAYGKSLQRRIRIWIDTAAPELHTLPWELLRDGDVILAADASTPFSRYLPVTESWGEKVTTFPIRVLVVIANPANLDVYNLAPLDVDREHALLQEAFVELPPDQVQLEFLNAPVTLNRLEHQLQSDYHILHFVGHGAFNPQRKQAMLYFQNNIGETQMISDDDFTALLKHQSHRPRLVFLAACQSATRSTRDAFAGLGPKLIRAGVPAVVAMQDTLAVEMTQKLTKTFYTELAQHGIVDYALNKARRQLLKTKSTDTAVPVLFMHLKDGSIWEPISSTLHKPSLTPALQEHTISRPQDLDSIKKLLLREAGPGQETTTALYGLGGIGKSTLAKSIAYDTEVLQHFPDGVLWATLGEEPETLPLLSEWIQALGDDKYTLSTEKSTILHLRSLLKDKAALLVLDDVWDPEHIEPFLESSGDKCRILITTRHALVIDAAKAQSYHLDVMTSQQALELFEKHLARPLQENEYLLGRCAS